MFNNVQKLYIIFEGQFVIQQLDQSNSMHVLEFRVSVLVDNYVRVICYAITRVDI